MSDSHSDLDLYDFSLLQDNDISGSANAKFKSCVCVFTDWAKTPSVTRGGGVPSQSVLGPRTRAWQRSRPGTALVQ